MILHYDWADELGDPPDMGTWLEISGDPDKLVLRGAVVRIFQEDDQPVVSILMADGQPGAEELQEWLALEGTLGVKISDRQTGVL